MSERKLTIGEYQEALGDYYDSGTIGEPPNRTVPDHVGEAIARHEYSQRWAGFGE